MEIILKKDVANLGNADDIVTVKSGYALNYLIPQGFAILATESAKKVLAENIRQRAHKEAKLRADAEALAARIAEATVKIAVKVSESGGIDVDKKDITINDTVKELGTFEASVKCYKDIRGTVKFEVVAAE